MVRIPVRVQNDLMNKCFEEQLFCSMYEAFLEEQKLTNGLSPVEVWCEACQVLWSLDHSKRPELFVLSLMDELRKRYMTFEDINKVILKRSEIEAERSVMEVMTTVLFSLARSSREVETNPYKDLAITISTKLYQMVGTEDFLQLVRLSEDAQERKGYYVDFKDGMHGVVPLMEDKYSNPFRSADDLAQCIYNFAVNKPNYQDAKDFEALLYSIDYPNLAMQIPSFFTERDEKRANLYINNFNGTVNGNSYHGMCLPDSQDKMIENERR